MAGNTFSADQSYVPNESHDRDAVLDVGLVPYAARCEPQHSHNSEILIVPVEAFANTVLSMSFQCIFS